MCWMNHVQFKTDDTLTIYKTVACIVSKKIIYDVFHCHV